MFTVPQRSLIVFLLCVLCFAPSTPAQQTNQTSSGQNESIKVETTEVLLDIVARDKRGKLLRDLKPEEVEVYDNGVKQNISSFRFAKGDATGVVPTNASGEKVSTSSSQIIKDPAKDADSQDPLRKLNLVAMVFDGLGDVDSRRLSQQAALDFVRTQVQPNTYVAVFRIDRRLYPLQEFTTDRALLENAVERATSNSYTNFEDISEKVRIQLEKVNMDSLVGSPTKAGPPFMNGAGGIRPSPDALERAVNKLLLNIYRITENMQRAQQGFSSASSLLSLVRGLSDYKGRKTLFYFAEGIQVPPNVEEMFRTLVSESNRANVSVYAFDPRGLMSTRTLQSSRDMLYAAANASKSQQEKDSSSPVTREEAVSEDTRETSLRRNDQGSLEALAHDTGGFLVADTNDLRTGIQRVAADMNSYYEIAYTPQSMLYDGKFHKLSVKINRSNVTLQTRSGYFAVPPTSASSAPTMPFEMPMLTALSASTLAHSFDYKMAVLHFEHNQKGQHQSLVLELPLSNFTFLEDKARKVYNTRFSVMAVVKDAGGRIVEKMSQNIPLEGALDRLETLKKANFVFLKDFWLPAGEYTLETLAMDHATSKTSATRTKLSVAQPSGSLGLSSILVVKRVDQLTPENQTADDPLNYQGSKISTLR